MAAESNVKSASRVLDIFEALSASPRGLSFTALQRALGIPKSSLHALLDVLVARGYLELDAARRLYTVGIRLWERSQAYQRHHDLVGEALPAMETIVGAINETVQLATLDGLENVYLAKVDSSHPLRLQSEVGMRLPAYATGLGKALLAEMDASVLAARLRDQALVPFTPHTFTDTNALLAELARTHARGFAIDNQEFTPGLCCVAVPIADHRGVAAAAMSVSIPLTRAAIELLSAALHQLAAGALHVSSRLGAPTPDPRLAALCDPQAARAALQVLEQAAALGIA